MMLHALHLPALICAAVAAVVLVAVVAWRALRRRDEDED